MDPLTMITIAKGLASVTGLDKKVSGWINSPGGKVAQKVVGIAQEVTGVADPEDALKEIRLSEVKRQAFLDACAQRKHELKKISAEDRKDARAMYKQNDSMADYIARRIINWNLPAVMILGAVQVAVMIWVKDSVVASGMSALLGGSITYLWKERQTVIEFFFGASYVGEPDE